MAETLKVRINVALILDGQEVVAVEAPSLCYDETMAFVDRYNSRPDASDRVAILLELPELEIAPGGSVLTNSKRCPVVSQS